MYEIGTKPGTREEGCSITVEIPSAVPSKPEGCRLVHPIQREASGIPPPL
jgi:hypothetical protein